MILRSNGTDQNAYDEVITNNCYRITPDLKGLVLDIGANVGCFSHLCSQYTKVLAFEPEPHNWQVLQQNLNPNIQAFNLAVGKPGQGKIINAAGCSALKEDEGEICQVISLDDIPFTRCSLCKIDTEGSEDDIIAYASDETLQKIDKLVMELHPGDRELGKMGKRLAKFFHLTRESNLLWGVGK